MKRNSWLILLAACCIMILPSVNANENSEGDFWETKTSMPQASSSVKAVTFEDNIYVFGKTFTYKYTPATDTWTQKTAMPYPRTGFAVAEVENKIYIIGGNYREEKPNGGVSDSPTGTNQVYDPKTDTWERKQALPQAVFTMSGAHVVDGKIYVIIGEGTSLTVVYDPAADNWTRKTPPPWQGDSGISCVIDKKIYVITYEFDVHVYNPQTDEWSKAANIPEFYSSRSIAATMGVQAPEKIYVIGGYFSPEFADLRMVQTNYAYDPQSDIWSKAADMPTARAGVAVATYKDKIFCIGGALTCNTLAGQATDVVEVYTPQSYQDNSPSTSPNILASNQPILTETSTIIIVTVAGIVIAATGITVRHFKRNPTKHS
jgi:N-acetylneuraminic acid mutarotase